MKKKSYIICLAIVVLLTACRNVDEQPDKTVQNETVEDNIKENDTEENKTEQSSEETEKKKQLKAPTREEVLAKRQVCLDGMLEEEIAIVKSNIKKGNLVLEHAYLDDNIFEIMSDPDDLMWNYVELTGLVQIGYAFKAGEEYQESSGVSFKEYAMEFGVPVAAYNDYDAEKFIELMEEMKNMVKVQSFKEDFENLIVCMEQAKNTHDVKYIEEIYYILHDMDYYLLRYAPDDVGPYVRDTSTIDKYYGALEVYH